MKIAKNNCYGGFSLNKACALGLREKGVQVTMAGECYPDGSGPKKLFGSVETFHLSNENFGITDDNNDAWRADHRLIETLEELGCENCGTQVSKISITDIPDGTEWEIDEYDGIETIHESHRSW